MYIIEYHRGLNLKKVEKMKAQFLRGISQRWNIKCIQSLNKRFERDTMQRAFNNDSRQQRKNE